MSVAATIPRQGQWVNGPKEVSMARRRYQNGSLVPNRGIPTSGRWVGRWREDVIQPDGTIKRQYMWETLGAIQDYPTRKLALRALEAVCQPSTVLPTGQGRLPALRNSQVGGMQRSFLNTNPVRKARHEANCGSGSSKNWAVVRSRIWTARDCKHLFLVATAIPKRFATWWQHFA